MSDLWILAGQSNMEGVGLLRDVEPPSEKVRVFAHSDEWQQAVEPLHWLLESPDPVHAEIWAIPESEVVRARQEIRQNRATGAGLGLPFAKAVVQATGRAIDLVPCAHGGTSMEQWDPGKKHLGGRSLYGAMLRRARRALETAGDAQLKGVLWYQGESDAGPELAPLYFERMQRLIASIRQDFESPDLPFFLVQLGMFSTVDSAGWEGALSWSQVREMQRRLAEDVPHTAVAPAIDLDLDDPIHIGTQGLKRLGRRLANIALNKVYGKATSAGITLAGVASDTKQIRVRFGGVSGGLKAPDPAGRVPGFAIGVAGERPEATAIYKAEIAPDNPSEVILHTQEPVAKGEELWYGWGLAPFCQLTDQADMAVPAFGPVAL